jgi:hypothetical protein
MAADQRYAWRPGPDLDPVFYTGPDKALRDQQDFADDLYDPPPPRLAENPLGVMLGVTDE